MKPITNVGDLPEHLKIFLKQLGGYYDNIKLTEFWEAESITEFEKGAAEIGYEIIPAMDMSTGKGFLVGMDAKDPVKINNEAEYSTLVFHFIELSHDEYTAWTKKIISHREQQQQDMRDRQQKRLDAEKRLKRR